MISPNRQCRPPWWQPCFLALALVMACGTPSGSSPENDGNGGGPAVPSDVAPPSTEPVIEDPEPGMTGEPVIEPEAPPGPAVDWPGARPALRLASHEGGNCAIGEDRQVSCWGNARLGPGEFKQISGAGWVGRSMCGLTVEGYIYCWSGGGAVDEGQPLETFKRVFTSSRLGCAVQLDDHVYCWGDPTEPQALIPPDEPLTGVSVGGGAGCGFTSGGVLTCWGESTDIGGEVRTRPDRTDYVAVFLGGAACGIYGNGNVGCWLALRDPPTGDGYVQVASAYSLVCALHMSGRVDCTGRVLDDWAASSDAIPYPRDVTFEEISVGDGWVCGITTERTVRCWGIGSGSGSPSEDFRVISLEDNVQ